MRRTDAQSAAVPIKISYFNGRVVLQLHQKPGGQGRPLGEVVHIQELAGVVEQCAGGAQAVQRGDAGVRCEVAVAAAADADAPERQPAGPGQLPGFLKEGGLGEHHRLVHPALDLQPDPGIDGLQGHDLPVDPKIFTPARLPGTKLSARRISTWL